VPLGEREHRRVVVEHVELDLHDGEVRRVGEHLDLVGVVRADAPPPHEAVVDELLERRGELLGDRRARRRGVQLVDVDVVAPEPAERGLQRLAHVGGGDVDAGELAGRGVDRVAELRRDEHVGVRREHRGQQLLAAARAVRVGGVEQRHAELDAAVQGPGRLVLVDARVPEGLVAARHPAAEGPAAEAERAGVEAGASEASSREGHEVQAATLRGPCPPRRDRAHGPRDPPTRQPGLDRSVTVC
jgi:hypothetical protein